MSGVASEGGREESPVRCGRIGRDRGDELRGVDVVYQEIEDVAPVVYPCNYVTKADIRGIRSKNSSQVFNHKYFQESLR